MFSTWNVFIFNSLDFVVFTFKILKHHIISLSVSLSISFAYTCHSSLSLSCYMRTSAISLSLSPLLHAYICHSSFSLTLSLSLSLFLSFSLSLLCYMRTYAILLSLSLYISHALSFSLLCCMFFISLSITIYLSIYHSLYLIFSFKHITKPDMKLCDHRNIPSTQAWPDSSTYSCPTRHSSERSTGWQQSFR